MANKTIPELETRVAIEDTDAVPMDDGDLTYKLLVGDLADYIFARNRLRQTMAWNGTDYQKTVDVSAFTEDAKILVWSVQDINANNNAQMTGCVIDFPTATDVRITFGEDFPPAAGDYYLVGV